MNVLIFMVAVGTTIAMAGAFVLAQGAMLTRAQGKWLWSGLMIMLVGIAIAAVATWRIHKPPPAEAGNIPGLVISWGASSAVCKLPANGDMTSVGPCTCRNGNGPWFPARIDGTCYAADEPK